jgi:hypothetical protein
MRFVGGTVEGTARLALVRLTGIRLTTARAAQQGVSEGLQLTSAAGTLARRQSTVVSYGMVTVGSVSREEASIAFPFLSSRFRGRRSAIKEFTSKFACVTKPATSLRARDLPLQVGPVYWLFEMGPKPGVPVARPQSGYSVSTLQRHRM